MSELLLDAVGRRRSPATTPGFHVGRPPRNKGVRYPADPPTVEEIVAVMRAARSGPHGFRLRGLIAVLWRAGLRIPEALALGEADLDRRRGALLVRRGKGRSAPRSRHGRVGVGATTAVAPDARRVAHRSAFLCPHRSDARPAVVMRSGSSRASPYGRSRRSPPTLCPAPAAPCTCCRNGPRERATDRDPTPARATATSASRRSTYRASTMLRSSTLSTPGVRP
jgi:integrase